MKVQSAIDEIKKLQKIICQNSPSLEFDIDEIVIRDEFKNWYKDHVPNKDTSQKSGIYLFSDSSSNEILYIGKAGADNISAEIWGKFGAPKINEKSKQPEFTKSRIAKYAPKDLTEKIIKGDICIAVTVISPKEVVSLIEVYLQTLCSLEEGVLPRLNNRIG